MRLILGLLLVAAVGFTSPDSHAAADERPHAKATLLISHDVVSPGETLLVGVHLEIERGWHLYWTNPGDSGLATAIHWKLQPGFSAGELLWPVPQRFRDGDMVTFGFEKEFLLLVEIETPRNIGAGSAMPLAASVEWLACKDLCLPGAAQIQKEVRFEAGKSRRSKDYSTLEKARQRLPQRVLEWSARARLKGSAVELTLETTDAPALARVGTVDFFPFDEGVLDLAKPPTLERGAGQVTVTLPRNLKAVTAPKMLRGVLVTPKGWDAKGRQKAMLIETELRG